jgi:formylglycine-generating enzyme required for sulfatase activity
MVTHDNKLPEYPAHRTDKFIEPELVRVPAGEFWMGSDKSKDPDAYDNEFPQHRLNLPEFWIAKYPVTNEEYRPFLLANPQQYKPNGWDGSNFPTGKERHPVVSITWYDTLAYCRWLAEMTGKSYRLPSEAEWEKAARGTDGRIYPWGNPWDTERCNTFDKGPGTTTPVGQYSPKGDSPYGCADIAGNVWEWTHSLLNPYKYNAEDGREDEKTKDCRVLRGGSFVDGARLTRCAQRHWRGQGSTYFGVGFRVMVDPL